MSHPSMVIQASLASESSLTTFRNNLLWHLQDAVVTLDQNGQISFWNPAAEKLLGQRPEEAIGRHYLEILKPANRTKPELAHWLEHPEQFAPLEAVLIQKSGQTLPLTIQAFDYQGADRQVITLLLQAVPSHPIQEQTAQEMMAWLRCNRNLDEALNFTVKKLGELIIADICRIWLYEPENEEFRPLRHEFLAPNLQASHPGLPTIKPVNLREGDGRGKALYIPDTRRWGAALEAHQAKEPWAEEHQPPNPLAARSLLRIPLIYEEECYGLLQAECMEQANPWGEEAVLQAQRITDVVSSIIHQARQEELGQAVLQQRARQQEMLAILSQRALLDPYFPVFMELAAVMISKTLGVERCRILERPNQPDGNLISHATVGYERQWPEPSAGRPMDSLAAYTLACNQPVIAEDMGVETRFAADGPLSGERIKSAAAVLICQPQGVYGVLEVASSRRRAFRTHDISFLQAVANVLGQVAERAQAKKQAHQDKEPYQLVLDAVGYGFWTLELEIGEFQGNERFCALLGRGPEFTQSPLDLVLAWIHPEDRTSANALFAPKTGQEQAIHLPLRLQHAWGHFVTLQFQALIFHNEAGKPIRVAALCQNMAALTSLATGNGEDHRETVKKLGGLLQLMETNTLGFMLWRQNGKVLHSNPALLSLLGYNQDDVAAGRLDWRKLTPPESATKDEQALRQIFTSGFAMPYEKQYLTREGQLVEVLQGAARLPDYPEEGVSFVLDITHKNQEISQLQRALEREQLRNRIIAVLEESPESDLSLNTVAEEIGAFFQADRCTITRWTNAKTATEPFQITRLAQYRASDELELVTLEHIPAIEFRRYLQGGKARWIHFPNLYTFTQAIQGFSLSNPGIAKLASSVSHYWKTYRIQSYFSLDIKVENNYYGSLSLHQCAYSKSWPQEDLEFLEQIAQHLGRVMHQEARHRQERQVSRELGRQHALMKNIIETQGHGQGLAETPRLLQEVLKTLLAQSEHGQGFIAEIIATADDSQPNILMRAELTPRNGTQSPIGMDVLQLLAEQLQTNSQPLFSSPELEADQPLFENFLALPLLRGKQLIGLLGLANVTDPSIFSASEALNAYASIASNLLTNEQLQNQKNKDWDCLQASMKLAQYQATQLERSNHELEQFAVIASHDLKAPLRKVMIFSEFLKSSIGEQLPLESADFLARIQKSTRKMQSLISTLLVLSQINHQHRPFEPVNLGQTIQEALIDLEDMRKESKGSVFVGETMRIDADNIQMYQVLQNLIGNALKFHKPGQAPIVTVSAQAVDEHTCEIVVKDNGIGFDEKNLNRIFKVYERLHGENEYEGTGLGLAIVQKIVERHCGTISAHSIPGQGATFIIRLPIRQSEHLIFKGKTTR